MSTYTLCAVCVSVCVKKEKKKRFNNTIFSGLYRFRVHCAKLGKKNNNSDNKMDLVIRNLGRRSCVLLKLNSQICSPAVTSCGPRRCGGSIQHRLLLLVLPAHINRCPAGATQRAAGRWGLVLLLSSPSLPTRRSTSRQKADFSLDLRPPPSPPLLSGLQGLNLSCVRWEKSQKYPKFNTTKTTTKNGNKFIWTRT